MNYVIQSLDKYQSLKTQEFENFHLSFEFGKSIYKSMGYQ